MICDPTEHWSSCSLKVKKAISEATTITAAFEATQVWAERYDALYKNNPSDQWMPDDQDRMRQIGETLFDEAIGKYLDPAALAFSLALARYLPTLSGIFGFLTSPWANAFYILLVPSPIANEFQEAKPINDDIAQLLRAKFEQLMPFNWRDNYSTLMMEPAFNQVKGGVIP